MDDCWKERASRAMDRYACGDGSAFSELYDLLSPRLSSFLLRRTHNAAQAEDLLQQTFMNIHSARQHFARGADVVPWAFAIARRLLIDTYRKSGREVLECEDESTPERESVAPGAEPDRLAARRLLARRIEEELTRVPEAHRMAFDLVQRDGLSMAEAAEVLGTTVAAVKLRAHRTYEALRQALGDDVREELEGVP
jgi:RNA polymerase sigma-70 factor (ECF subfamily)